MKKHKDFIKDEDKIYAHAIVSLLTNAKIDLGIDEITIELLIPKENGEMYSLGMDIFDHNKKTYIKFFLLDKEVIN